MHNKLTFGQQGDVPVAWIWVLSAKKIKNKTIRAINLMGKEIVIFKDALGALGALDAYCPHMGAHLGDGKVEGQGVRCFFHNWKFDKQGQCIDIPCLDKLPQKKISIQHYTVQEKHGLIWLWTGKDTPHQDIPYVPELKSIDFEYSLGNRWRKKCHPNIVMINAIDEHHFQTVHKLPGHILNMEPNINNEHNILFENQGKPPQTHWFGRWISKFYKNAITYDLSYYNGINGTVTLGPDFLHLYLMFALREEADGSTFGQTIAFTKKRKGILGWICNYSLLQITKLAGLYFAMGDTKVFQKIIFNFKNPIKKDKAVIAFIKHLEKQNKANWLQPKTNHTTQSDHIAQNNDTTKKIQIKEIQHA